MPSLPDFFEFLPACKVVVCKTHGLCLRRPHIGPHLRSKHYTTEKAYDDVIQAMSDLDVAFLMNEVCLPVAGGAPIKGLPILDGFECCATQECPFLTVQVGGLGAHMSKHHMGLEPFKRTVKYQNKVKLQRFFPESNFTGYFIVDPESSMPGFPQVSAMTMKASLRPSVSKKLRAEEVELEEEEANESGVRSPRFYNSITQ